MIVSSVVTLARASAFGARVNLDAILSLLLAPPCIFATQAIVSSAPLDNQSSFLTTVFFLPGTVSSGHPFFSVIINDEDYYCCT